METDGSDTMYGYSGDDTFTYRNGLDADNDFLVGSFGADRIFLVGAGVYDFRNTNVDSIEEIHFEADGINVDKINPLYA